MKRLFMSKLGKIFLVSCVICLTCVIGTVKLTKRSKYKAARRAERQGLNETRDSTVNTAINIKNTITKGDNTSIHILTERSESIQTTKEELKGWMKRFPWDPSAKLDKYEFRISPEDKCRFGGNNFTLLVLIKSAPSNSARRDAARRTFIRGAETLNVSVRFLFVMGVPGEGQEGVDVETESKTHGDILQGDFSDHYYNLAVKLIMGFKWALEFCQNSEFVMTMDDDVMPDIVSLVNDLRAIPPKDRLQFVIGTRIRQQPSRSANSKWYAPKELYPGDLYPTFPLGQGYVMSQTVAKKLYQASKETPAPLPFDDVYCGILLDKLRIEIYDQVAWRRQCHPKKELFSYLQIEVRVQEMESAWKKIEKTFD